MGLQDFYDSLIRVARLNPSITMKGAQFDDSCHSVLRPEEPPHCFSPQDLSDPAAKNIQYDNGETVQTLGFYELLEAYRKLIILDNSDGKLDGKLSGPKLFLPDLQLKRTTTLRYYGDQWTPEVRLQHYLKWYEGELGKQLMDPHPEFGNARLAVKWEFKTALAIPYPLMPVEKEFITETAGRLQQRGYDYVGNLVFDMIGKSRAITLRVNSAAEDDLAKSLYFLQEDRRGKVAVFFTASFDKDGKRIAFHVPNKDSALRGPADRKTSLNRLATYLTGRKIAEGEYFHVENALRDLYIYSYLAYEGKGKKMVSLGPDSEVYFRIVVLHEALHAAALLEANGYQPAHPSGEPFDWEKLVEPLKMSPPGYKEPEAFVQYLANLLQLQRATFDVQLQLDGISDTRLLTPEEEQKRKMATRLRGLAGEATEYLTDMAAWEMTIENITRSSQESTRERLLNPNEEKVLTKILSE